MSTPSVIAYHFWSPTCVPCATIKPAIAVLIEEFPQVYFVGVNTHADPQGLSAKFGVQVVPTIVVLKNGVEVGRYSDKQVIMYYTLIKKALA